MKIRTRLVLSMAFIFLLFVVLSISAVSTSWQEGQMDQQLALIEKTQLDTYALNQLTTDYLLNREDRQKVQWETQYSTVSADIEGLKPTGPGQQALVGSMRKDLQHLKEIFSEVSPTIETMESSGRVQPGDTFTTTSWSRMEVRNQGIIADASRLAGLVRQESERVRNASTLVMYALLGTILAILLMNYFLLYRRFLTSVDDLRTGTEVIRSGNLDFRIPEKGDDEFHTLAASFNEMTASRKNAQEALQQKTLDLQDANRQIISSREELRRNYTELARSQEELEASERQYRTILETMQDAYFRTDASGVITLANPAAATMYGYASPREIIGTPAVNLFRSPEDYFGMLGNLSPDGTLHDYTCQAKRKDGSLFWTSGNVRVNRGADGKIWSSEGFARDISERKQAEIVREEQSRQRQLALDAARLGWWHYDPVTRVSTYDARSREIYGILENEKSYDEILALIHPDDQPRIIAAVEAALDPSEPKPYSLEYRVCAADGVKRWVRAFGMAFFESPGSGCSGVSLVGTMEDITESKNTEQVLRENEERFREIFNNANDGIELIEFSDDGTIGRFIEVNEITTRTLLYTREELLAMSPVDINTRAYNPPLHEVMKQLQATGHATFETEHRCKDGTVFPVEINTHIISWKEKKALLSVVRNISERKEAEEMIRVMNSKLALMNDVTYQDIQNKLTAIRGYIDLCSRIPGEEERMKATEKISVILGSIHALIQKTKEYQSMGVARPRWIEVEPVVRSQFSSLSGKPPIVLETDVHGLQIYADPAIDRVFYNLIKNAVTHGEKVTRIVVRCREAGPGLFLTIEDDGTGIPADGKPHLFDRVVAGEGRFGLFFVREFLSISRMTIFEDGEPGKGARFTITVPHGMFRFSPST